MRPTHRMRRGRLVEIPEQWRGKVTDRQTIRKRPSKKTRKARNTTDRNFTHSASPTIRGRQEALAPRVEEWEGET